MKTIVITFPPTPYTDENANRVLIELGAPQFVRENQPRAAFIRESVLLGRRMAWGEETDSSLAIHYDGAVPTGVAYDLEALVARGAVTSWARG